VLRPAITFPRLRAQAIGTAASSIGSSLSASASSGLSAGAGSALTAAATSGSSAGATSALDARQGGIRRLLVGLAVMVGLAAALGALLRRRLGG
jgi:hypothetical protein